MGFNFSLASLLKSIMLLREKISEKKSFKWRSQGAMERQSHILMDMFYFLIVSVTFDPALIVQFDWKNPPAQETAVLWELWEPESSRLRCQVFNKRIRGIYDQSLPWRCVYISMWITHKTKTFYPAEPPDTVWSSELWPTFVQLTLI